MHHQATSCLTMRNSRKIVHEKRAQYTVRKFDKIVHEKTAQRTMRIFTKMQFFHEQIVFLMKCALFMNMRIFLKNAYVS